ncbi:hypothetical protein FACS1894125_2610 [Actinomycetota bacterium]|nr:hypothetical protein FACS1894125_2610 [Actinomycetota bacterium]
MVSIFFYGAFVTLALLVAHRKLKRAGAGINICLIVIVIASTAVALILNWLYVDPTVVKVGQHPEFKATVGYVSGVHCLILWGVIIYVLHKYFRTQLLIHFKFDRFEKILIVVALLYMVYIFLLMVVDFGNVPARVSWYDGSDSPLIYDRSHNWGAAIAYIHIMPGLLYSLIGTPLSFILEFFYKFELVSDLEHWQMIIACTSQIIINTLTIVLFYKVLKSLKLNIVVSIVFTAVFLFSHTFIPLSIAPESYSATLFGILLTIYAYLNIKDRSLFGLLVIFTFFCNPATVAFFLPLYVQIAMKNKHIFSSLSTLYRTKSKSFRYIVAVLGVLVFIATASALFYIYIYRWVFRFLGSDSSLYYADLLFGYILFGQPIAQWNPPSEPIHTALSFDVVMLVVAVLIYAATIISIFASRKSPVAQSAAMTLIVALLLNQVVKQGSSYETMLFVPLYSYAVYLLLAMGADKVCSSARQGFSSLKSCKVFSQKYETL